MISPAIFISIILFEPEKATSFLPSANIKSGLESLSKSVAVNKCLSDILLVFGLFYVVTSMISLII